MKIIDLILSLNIISVIYIHILKNVIFYLQSSDLIAYLKEQLDSKEKELFVVVSKEVEEKQLWMHQYALQNHHNDFNHKDLDHHCDSSDVTPTSDYRNRDAECLRLNEVRNCVNEDY